ncbi:MAG: tetratricopeptide repeat protein [Candidatus Doudnabacteria bacterium]|nr:tetratricopeptide repeat protein [Candidatus Doudnabacteria bacterium]
MSYQIIPNIIFILAVLGMLLIIIRRLPEAAAGQSGSAEASSGQKLAAKGLPVIELSKIRSTLRLWLKKLWNFVLEAKDLRPHSVTGYQMKKIFGDKFTGAAKPAPPKPLTTSEVRNEQYYLNNIKLQPANFDHYDALGKFYISRENFSDASDVYIYLTNHRPANPDYHARLAFCHYQLKNFHKAAESYKASLALDSTQPNRYYNLGLCLEQDGNAQEAAVNFEKAASLEPSAKYYSAASAAYQKAGQTQKAQAMGQASNLIG